MTRNTPETHSLDAIIGNKIKWLRIENGASRTHVAAVMGVTQQQVSKYENGKDRVSASRLILLARSFNKPLSYFVDAEECGVVKSPRRTGEAMWGFNKLSEEQQQAVNILLRSMVRTVK